MQWLQVLHSVALRVCIVHARMKIKKILPGIWPGSLTTRIRTRTIRRNSSGKWNASMKGCEHFAAKWTLILAPFDQIGVW